MKKRVPFSFVWYVMIFSRLVFWGLAYYVVLPHGKASTTPYLEYLLMLVALALAIGSSLLYFRGNTKEKLLAYSERALKRRVTDQVPSVAHGYQSKLAFSWSLSQWISVLGIIAAQLLLPLNFIHGFCGVSLILVMWHRPDFESLKDL